MSAILTENGFAKVFNLTRKVTEDIHRVIVDGIQIGAYTNDENVLNEVKRHLKQLNKLL
ncbi:hypothetical protein [Peribacillus sp. NJ4]|uniref:hypothetical protein n=1 Tax=Peribacillus sp. NJ4 TaxID=3055862 RepID=UPI00338EAA97